MQTKQDKKLLIIGSIESLINDKDSIPSNCQICSDVLDGLEKAATDNFSVIAIVMRDLTRRLNSLLKALKKSCPHAKIILLCSMPEEPCALKFVEENSNGQKLIDDYLICPAEIAEIISIPKKKTTQKTAARTPYPEIQTEKKLQNDRKIKEYQQEIKSLEKLALTDGLTNLKNRRYFLEFAKQIITHADNEKKQVTILMFDIDNFKHYNDVYGHSAGDDILKQAAILMKRCCREHDVVARIGGDEFAVIFWQLPEKNKSRQTQKERRYKRDHPQEAIFISKRFRQELKDTELDSLGTEGKGVLTISGGLATFPRDGDTIEKLLKQADNALLQAKKSGKNRIYLVGKSENDISDIQ
jgi:diguanylate cyclase (GGDEF)-like protein